MTTRQFCALAVRARRRTPDPPLSKRRLADSLQLFNKYLRGVSSVVLSYCMFVRIALVSGVSAIPDLSRVLHLIPRAFSPDVERCLSGEPSALGECVQLVERFASEMDCVDYASQAPCNELLSKEASISFNARAIDGYFARPSESLKLSIRSLLDRAQISCEPGNELNVVRNELFRNSADSWPFWKSLLFQRGQISQAVLVDNMSKAVAVRFRAELVAEISHQCLEYEPQMRELELHFHRLFLFAMCSHVPALTLTYVMTMWSEDTLTDYDLAQDKRRWVYEQFAAHFPDRAAFEQLQSIKALVQTSVPVEFDPEGKVNCLIQNEEPTICRELLDKWSADIRGDSELISRFRSLISRTIRNSLDILLTVNQSVHETAGPFGVASLVSKSIGDRLLHTELSSLQLLLPHFVSAADLRDVWPMWPRLFESFVSRRDMSSEGMATVIRSELLDVHASPSRRIIMNTFCRVCDDLGVLRKLAHVLQGPARETDQEAVVLARGCTPMTLVQFVDFFRHSHLFNSVNHLVPSMYGTVTLKDLEDEITGILADALARLSPVQPETMHGEYHARRVSTLPLRPENPLCLLCTTQSLNVHNYVALCHGRAHCCTRCFNRWLVQGGISAPCPFCRAPLGTLGPPKEAGQ